MQLVKNNSQYKQIFPYDKKYLKADGYPDRYPCFVKITNQEGGIAGPYWSIKFIYPPKGCDIKSFQMGLEMSDSL